MDQHEISSNLLGLLPLWVFLTVVLFAAVLWLVDLIRGEHPDGPAGPDFDAWRNDDRA